MAKLEKPSAIDCLEDIIRLSDGLMVARGDLGVEMRPEQVPIISTRDLAREPVCGKAGEIEGRNPALFETGQFY
jgi:pyruvate kinase